MANSKAISIRIPDELLEKIDLLAEEKYKSHKGTPNRSLVVLDAIVAYFNTLSDTDSNTNAASLPNSVSVVEFNELCDVVNILSDSVRQLEDRIATSSDSVKKPNEDKSEQNQLNIILVSDDVIKAEDGFTPTDLAKRLGKEVGDVNSKKYQSYRVKGKPEEFLLWAKKLDPDGWGWEFREEKGRRGKYFPIKPLA